MSDPSSITGLQQWARNGAGIRRRTPFFGNAQYLSHASNSGLQAGAGDWTWCGWVTFSDVSQNQCIASKGNAAGNNYEWGLILVGGAPWLFYEDPPNNNTDLAQWGSSLSNGTQYFVVVQHDSGAGKISVNVNNSTAVLTTTTVTAAVGTGDFRLGAFTENLSYQLGAGASGASLRACGWAKSAISPTDLTALYNSGTPLLWSQLSGHLQGLFTSYWNLYDDATTDSAGSNTLTAHGGVKTIITQWDDSSGNGNHLQPSHTNTYDNMTPAPATVNGLDGVAGTGEAGAGFLYLDSLASVQSGTAKPFTFFAVFRCADPSADPTASTLMTFGNSGNSTPVTDLFVRNVSGTFTYAGPRRDDASNEVILEGGTPDTAWHYIVMIFDGATGYLRLDGVQIDTRAQSALAITLNTYSVYVHRRGGEDDHWNGESIENGLYNVALSGSDLTTLETYLAGLLASGSVGASAGTSTTAAVGASLAAAAAASSGTAAAAAAGASLSAAVGAASGIGAAAGAGASLAASAGTASGTSTASATSASLAAAAGAAAGAATVAGFSPGASTGSAAGTCTVAGAGASLTEAVGTVTGTCTVVGIAPGGIVTVAGPYYFTAAALYTPGASRGLVYAAGASAGQLSTE